METPKIHKLLLARSSVATVTLIGWDEFNILAQKAIEPLFIGMGTQSRSLLRQYIENHDLNALATPKKTRKPKAITEGQLALFG